MQQQKINSDLAKDLNNNEVNIVVIHSDYLIGTYILWNSTQIQNYLKELVCSNVRCTRALRRLNKVHGKVWPIKLLKMKTTFKYLYEYLMLFKIKYAFEWLKKQLNKWQRSIVTITESNSRLSIPWFNGSHCIFLARRTER